MDNERKVSHEGAYDLAEPFEVDPAVMQLRLVPRHRLHRLYHHLLGDLAGLSGRHLGQARRVKPRPAAAKASFVGQIA